MPVLSDKVFRQLLSISRSIAGQMDYDAVLRAFATDLKDIISHDHMDLVKLIEDGRLHQCYEVGIHTKWGALAISPEPTESAPIRDVLWGKIPYLLTNDALSDHRFHFDGALDGPIFAAKLRSRMIVPLRMQGRVFGSLNISSQKPGMYGPAEIELAQYCADLIAPYLYALSHAEDASRAAVAENEAKTREQMLRLGALRLTEGMEAERRRIAMDLHDQTLGDLSRIARMLARLRRDGLTRESELETIESKLGNCLIELRRVVDDLKPGVLELFGFSEAVQALLAGSVPAMNARLQVEVSDTSGGAVDRLPTSVRTALYRIVQEAINNVIRHSYASRTQVRIEIGVEGLTITVRDNGRGCERSAQASTGGISNMRTRAALIGARLWIGKADGASGTLLRLTLPLPDEAKTKEIVSALSGPEAIDQQPAQSVAGKDS